ncbi:MAG: amidohydrolase, partial [Methylococcales bacterium]|nr:amidohydrolase [Methylococcales bacterium]
MIKSIYTRLFALLFILNGCAIAERPYKQGSVIIRADRIFDGHIFRTNSSLLINNGKIAKIDTPAVTYNQTAKIIDLGNATLLPGFIELHAHLNYKQVSAETVLKHGITTLRDLGG